MTTQSDLVERRSSGDADLEMEIAIDAPVEAVFEFLVVPEKLFRWMGIGGEIDPVEGGRFEVHYPGDNVARGEFVEVARPSRVVVTWGWEHWAEVPPGSTTVAFDLVEQITDGATRTLVRLTHTGLPDATAGDRHVEGWSHFLPLLAHEAAREELRAAELALMLQRERVAEMRRALPLGRDGSDYEFDEFVGGSVQRRTLADLFADPDTPLVVYHFMYGKRQSEPCPMCSMWIDGWQGVAGHLAERLNLVIASSAPAEDWHRVAQQRGWHDLRTVTAAPSSFKVDIGGEDADGNLDPAISVWELVEGVPRLTYAGGAHIDGEHWRGLDLLSPVWHILDLTRPGRGDWMPSAQEATAAQE